MDTDRKKYRPPKWDVKDYLEEVKPKHEETYQQINLQATLTWGMTHTQLYRARKLAGVIEYILNGTEVRDPSTKKKKTIREPVCNAQDDLYSSGDIAGPLSAIAGICILGTNLPVAQLINLEHLHCGDCSQPEFPSQALTDQFNELEEAGLVLDFFDRFKNTYPDGPPADPDRARELDELLRRFGDYTIAHIYDTNSIDLRLLRNLIEVSE